MHWTSIANWLSGICTVLSLLGIDPASLVAGVLTTLFVVYVAPRLVKAIGKLIRWIKASKNKRDDRLLPFLRKVEKFLKGLKKGSTSATSLSEALAKLVGTLISKLEENLNPDPAPENLDPKI